MCNKLTVLTEMMTYEICSLDCRSMQNDIIFLDFKEAFDTMPHAIVSNASLKSKNIISF